MVSYRPSQATKEPASTQPRVEEERLRMKVLNGVEVVLRCQGLISQPRIVTKCQEINLREVPINKAVPFKIPVKNISRNNTMIQVKKARAIETIVHCETPSFQIFSE